MHPLSLKMIYRGPMIWHQSGYRLSKMITQVDGDIEGGNEAQIYYLLTGKTGETLTEKDDMIFWSTNFMIVFHRNDFKQKT